MTSIRSPKPLDLKFRPSRLFLGYFIALHSATAMSLCFVLPTPLTCISAILLAASAVYYIKRDVCFQLRQSVGRVTFADNSWRIHRGDIRRLGDVEIQRVDLLDAITLPYGVVLRFKIASGRAASIVVLPDHLGADQYRRLRQISNFARAS